MQTQTLSTTESAAAPFQLNAPEVITPVTEQAARTAVPMSADLKAAVDDQV